MVYRRIRRSASRDNRKRIEIYELLEDEVGPFS
jgi:hypothetical protein